MYNETTNSIFLLQWNHTSKIKERNLEKIYIFINKRDWGIEYETKSTHREGSLRIQGPSDRYAWKIYTQVGGCMKVVCSNN